MNTVVRRPFSLPTPDYICLSCQCRMLSRVRRVRSTLRQREDINIVSRRTPETTIRRVQSGSQRVVSLVPRQPSKSWRRVGLQTPDTSVLTRIRPPRANRAGWRMNSTSTAASSSHSSHSKGDAAVEPRNQPRSSPASVHNATSNEDGGTNRRQRPKSLETERSEVKSIASDGDKMKERGTVPRRIRVGPDTNTSYENFLRVKSPSAMNIHEAMLGLINRPKTKLRVSVSKHHSAEAERGTRSNDRPSGAPTELASRVVGSPVTGTQDEDLVAATSSNDAIRSGEGQQEQTRVAQHASAVDVAVAQDIEAGVLTSSTKNAGKDTGCGAGMAAEQTTISHDVMTSTQANTLNNDAAELMIQSMTSEEAQPGIIHLEQTPNKKQKRLLKAQTRKQEHVEGGTASGEAESTTQNGAATTQIVSQARMAASPIALQKAAAQKLEPTITKADQTNKSEKTKQTRSRIEKIYESTAIDASTLKIEPLDIEQPPVPSLSFGLDRVLFNSGVYQLQDPHSRVYNFDPYLQDIMPAQEFDFSALKEYKTSSEDVALAAIAKEHGKRYIGSTSSMTAVLAHFHYLLSHFRPINFNMLSSTFQPESTRFTVINRAPAGIFLRWKNGSYAIDADKENDTPNILMMLGKSMEKLLTMPKDDFERYRKSDPREVPQQEREAPEAYQYTTMGDMLMRSQLDAYDERLPGNGTFDLKTRAVVSIRMDAAEYEPMLGYEILTLTGKYESYEREYHDMLRSTMLKYMLQARMGRMDGIFVAYHNIERIFGFQYLPIHEIDRAMHGQVDRCLGDAEFKFSLDMLNNVLNEATKKFPEQSLRLLFETQGAAEKDLAVMHIFAEPVTEEEIDKIHAPAKKRMAEYEKKIMGVLKDNSDEHETEAAAPELSKVDDQEMSSAQSLSLDSAIESETSKEETSTDEVSPSQDVEQRRHRPLFHAQLLIENKVNGQLVWRPEGLKSDQTWTCKHSILVMTDDKIKASWALYAQARAARQATLSKPEDEDEEAAPKKDSWFLSNLRKLAAKGREFRADMNRLEDNKQPVVWKAS